jgi:small subunit ribosomal protein S21
MSKKQKQHQMIMPGNALGVNVVGTTREDLASAIKTWKRKVKSSNVLETVKDRKEYIKPSVQKRAERSKAEYIQYVRDLHNK